MEDDVKATLGAASSEVVTIRRSASMHYAGQAFELPVRLPDHDLGRDDLPALADAFEVEHERSYGHRLTDAIGVDIVALEVVAGTCPWDGIAPVLLPLTAPRRRSPSASPISARARLPSHCGDAAPHDADAARAGAADHRGIRRHHGGAARTVAWLDEHANIVIAFAE